MRSRRSGRANNQMEYVDCLDLDSNQVLKKYFETKKSAYGSDVI